MSDVESLAREPLTARLRLPCIWVSCSMGASQLLLSARYQPAGELRSQDLWGTSVARPPGKTLAECVEAGLYRVARAGSDGLLVPPGWDSLE